MASIYNLKPRFQALLRPISNGLAAVGVTANQVTLFALLLSIGFGAALAYWPHVTWILFFLPVVLFIRMALNAIDGMMAREHNMKSSLGAMLNELGDVVSDTALYLPFAFLPGVCPILIVAIVILAIIGEMAGVVAVQIGASRRYDGPFGKSDRAFAFSVLALVLAWGIDTVPWLDYVLGGFVALSVITILHRCVRAIREAK